MMRTFLSASLALGLLLAWAARVEAVTIGPKTVIVLGEKSPVAEQYAANELRDWLKQVLGDELAVAGEAAAADSRILVGADAAKLADAKFSAQGLGEEGVVIRTVGKDLILAGGRPRGTLYAVYTFLEDHVGYRWWAPGASFVPQKKLLEFEKIDYRYIPPLEYREPYWFSALDGDWAARNKCNGASERLDEKHGGKHVIEGFVHTFYSLIPPDKYYKEHPEWFSEVLGKRLREDAQLCLSNESMRAELVKNLKERLRKNPAAVMASVSQNDCFHYCQCMRCAAVDKEERSPAGSIIRFVNEVAADVEKDFPKVAISTLAYQYSRKPPAKARPRANVVVWLCSIECSFAKPLTDEKNADFRNDIEGWSKICNRLYVWDYTTNFANYILPHPNLNVLGPNVKFFADRKVVGLFEQGAYHTPGAEMMELRAWVLAKLLWNPSLDSQKLIDEFVAGYYGPAAGHVRAYLDTTHRSLAGSGDALGCFSGSDAKFLTFRVLAEGWAHLQGAEKAAQDDKPIRQRVRTAQLPVLYAFIVEWDRMRREAAEGGMKWPMPETKQGVYDEFMTRAKDIGLTHVAETRGIDWLQRVVKP